MDSLDLLTGLSYLLILFCLIKQRHVFVKNNKNEYPNFKSLSGTLFIFAVIWAISAYGFDTSDVYYFNESGIISLTGLGWVYLIWLSFLSYVYTTKKSIEEEKKKKEAKEKKEQEEMKKRREIERQERKRKEAREKKEQEEMKKRREIERQERKKKEEEEKKEQEKMKKRREMQRQEHKRKEEERQKENLHRRMREAALLKKIEEQHSPEILASYKKRKICFGMPVDLVKNILGPAYDKKEQVTKDFVKLSYKYGRSKSSRGNTTYKIRVNYEDGLVSGWRDL